MSHPARESFRQFNNLDPQARLDEFHKRFDRLKSEFQNTQRPSMFESANRPFFNNSWTDSNENANSANGHVPVEKTIPIHVQHERSRSEPVDNSSTQAAGSAPNNPVNDRMHFQDSMNFMPDNSFFQHQFPHSFAQNETIETGAEPRVHRIPIQVESRNSTISPTTKPVLINQQINSGNVSSQSVPNQANLNYSTQPTANSFSNYNDPNSKQTRVIEVPVQITKSSSTPVASKKVENDVQKSNSNVNSNTTNINESSSDPAIADPNKVYPMGYEPLPNNNQTEKTEKGTKKETPFDYVKEILDDLKNYEAQVHEFNGNTPTDKGYRFLDEMLTLCILRLDSINIDGNDELRKYRKSAINEVNRVAAILETKVSKSNQGNSTEVDEMHNQSGENSEEKANLSDVKSNEPKDKKEAKKLEKAKAKKEKEKAKKENGEKKEGRRIILFRGKNKNKANQNEATSSTGNETNDPAVMDVDPNNNDLKDDSTQSTSDHNSEVASTSSSSTLKGKETAV